MFQHVWLTSFPSVCPRTHLVLRVRGRRTEIGVHSIRMGDVVGEHTIYYATPGERIELKHIATTQIGRAHV